MKKLNKKYFGRAEVFSNEFTGTWGGEDSFIGIQAHMCKIFITVVTNEKSGIRHIDHERPLNKYEDSFDEYLYSKIDLLDEMQKNNPLTIDFFNSP